jgi:hypothetical protein
MNCAVIQSVFALHDRVAGEWTADAGNADRGADQKAGTR